MLGRARTDSALVSSRDAEPGKIWTASALGRDPQYYSDSVAPNKTNPVAPAPNLWFMQVSACDSYH